jgi:hypothetical protein
VSLASLGRSRTAVAALSLLLVDLLLRLVSGGPYRGATALLLAACAAVLLPLLPAELARPSLRLAAAPALAVGSFTVLVTTVSTLGIPLTEISIRATVAVFVVSLAVAGAALGRTESLGRGSGKREAAAVAAVLALAAFSLASAWDVVGPFPPRGTDWGHYFLYADEVERQQSLLIDDPLAGPETQVFADPVMVGALYGSVLTLDGVSSRSLGAGAAAASAFSTASVVAAAGGLWGIGAGLAAGTLYAVAPIRMDPMYWHGLATALALVFVPLVVLALGLMFAGRRDPRTIGLLGFGLVGVIAAHSTTAVVVAAAVTTAVLLDGARAAFARRGPGEGFLARWWRHGIVAPVAVAAAGAAIFGAGVGVHVLRQARRLGEPVDYRFFEPDWLSLRALEEYLSTGFLALGVVAVVVLAWRRSSGDAALLAVASLVLGCVAVSQLWRLGIAYEYRRVVYPFGLALALLVGAAAARIGRWTFVAPVGLLACAALGHQSVGFRLPERLLSDRVPTSTAPAALDALRGRIERGDLPDARLVVADRCLHFVVPYLLERPTIAAFEDWQVAYRNRVPAARKARSVVEGGPAGRRVAANLHVGYVVADPRCTPAPAPGLGGRTVVRGSDVLVLRLPS